MIFESIEVVMTAHLPKECDNSFPALTLNRESSPNPAPFFKRIFVRVPDHANAALLLLKANIIAGLDTQDLRISTGTVICPLLVTLARKIGVGRVLRQRP